jgi:aminoglycoside phosphotransferase (APT) family kinase protein
VLDWELSTLGHPLADLAYNCMVYHLEELQSSGIPSETEYIAAYCRRTGRGRIEHWDFYMAFSLFRSASIAQGVYARALQGNASSETAADFGPAVNRIAEVAWALVERPSG